MRDVRQLDAAAALLRHPGAEDSVLRRLGAWLEAEARGSVSLVVWADIAAGDSADEEVAPAAAAKQIDTLKDLMEMGEAQLDTAREAEMTNVHNYELEKAEAQSDTAREAETTVAGACGDAAGLDGSCGGHSLGSATPASRLYSCTVGR